MWLYNLFFRIMNKLVFSAPERNKQPLLEVIQKVIPEKFDSKTSISALEIGAGTGQHALYFTENIPSLIWHPTDIDYRHIKSIEAYINESTSQNILLPFQLDIDNFDAKKYPSLKKKYDMVVAINLIHISPWSCTKGLFKAAGELLPPGGVLMTYGPYSLHGRITPESNVRFNQSLKVQYQYF